MASALPVAQDASLALSHSPLDRNQVNRAASALLRKIQSDQTERESTAHKSSLLADADDGDDDADTANVAVWLVLTTKKHVTDKPRLKPGKILLPKPYLDPSDPGLKICLITADPQRKYKDLVAHPSFPLELSSRIGRVLGVTKLKAKYKTFEARRQLLGEYDVFLADDRIVTHLPQLLGKVFYKTGAKRPVPIDLQGKRQNFDDQGHKRRKLAEGGSKVARDEVKPAELAREITRAISSALVHLSPSTTTAVKVGRASMEPLDIQQNVEAVTSELVERYVPRKWSNVRAIHIKGPETAALPLWLTDELWEDENDVLEERRPERETKNDRKRKQSAIAEGESQVIEVPGPDGRIRRLEKPSKGVQDANDLATQSKITKKSKVDSIDDTSTKAIEKAEKKARQEALQQQKSAAKAKAKPSGVEVAKTKIVADRGKTKIARTTVKAA